MKEEAAGALPALEHLLAHDAQLTAAVAAPEPLTAVAAVPDGLLCFWRLPEVPLGQAVCME